MLYLFFSKSSRILNYCLLNIPILSIQGFDHCVYVFVVIHRQNFTRDYLEAVSDSEHAVKTKNSPIFMNFPNIKKIWDCFPSGVVL